MRRTLKRTVERAGRAVRRGFVLALGIAAFSGCSFDTQYTLSVDVLSFLDESERSESFSIPDSEARDIYVFPALKLVPADVSPGIEFELGYPVEFPDYDSSALPDLPEDVELTLHVRLGALIENFSSFSLPGGQAELYIAELGTEDVYEGNSPVATASVPQVSGNSSEAILLDSTLPLDRAIVESGGVQLGVKIRLNANAAGAGNSIDGAVTLTEARIELSGFPMRALP